MKCPNCRNQYNYKKEKSADGNTTCLICGTVAPTKDWQKPRITKRERQLETELAEARAEIERKNEELDMFLAEQQAMNEIVERKSALIGQMRDALKWHCAACPDTNDYGDKRHCEECKIKTLLDASEGVTK